MYNLKYECPLGYQCNNRNIDQGMLDKNIQYIQPWPFILTSYVSNPRSRPVWNISLRLLEEAEGYSSAALHLLVSRFSCPSQSAFFTHLPRRLCVLDSCAVPDSSCIVRNGTCGVRMCRLRASRARWYALGIWVFRRREVGIRSRSRVGTRRDGVGSMGWIGFRHDVRMSAGMRQFGIGRVVVLLLVQQRRDVRCRRRCARQG